MKIDIDSWIQDIGWVTQLKETLLFVVPEYFLICFQGNNLDITDAGRATAGDDIDNVRRGKLLKAIQAAHNVPD